MKKYHDIEQLVFEGEKMILKVSNREYSFRLLDISPKLAKASPAEKDIKFLHQDMAYTGR